MADQLSAVKHALLHCQYVALSARTDFPVELLQQLAEGLDYDLAAVEAQVTATMKTLADYVQADIDRKFVGGAPGGGKQEALYRAGALVGGKFAGRVTERGGVVLTCVA